jgi:hypothetical protein
VAPASAQESELDLVPEGYDPGMSDPGAEYGQDVGYEEQFANQPPLDAYEDAYSGEMPELPPLEAYEQDLDSSPDEENTPVPF